MKKTLRTLSLVAAGLLGSLSVAHAQPVPPGPPAPPAPFPSPAPAPPPPPAAPAPPPVDFGVAPAGLPSEPEAGKKPLPQVNWGSNASTDSISPPEEKKQSPFYFTRFTWGNSASTKIFGVGSDYIGTEDEQYNMSFVLNLRYYFLNRDLDKAYVNVNAGFEVQVTDSVDTSTTTKHQPLLNDTVVGVGYGHTVYQSVDRQWKTTPGISAGFVLPTSQASMDQGKYLSASLNANIIQAIPLAGNKSDWFSDVLLFGTVGYSHQFSRCTTPCDPSGAPATYPRQIAGVAPAGQDAAAQDVASDQLAAGMLASDRLKLNFTYFLTLYKDLSLGNTWEVVMPFKYSAPGTTVYTPTGPVPLGGGTTALNPVTTFDVSLSYLLFNTARIDLGYQNVSPELVDNMGQRNSIFYAVGGAVFYGNVSLYIDSLLDRATAPTDQKKLGEGRFHRFLN